MMEKLGFKNLTLVEALTLTVPVITAVFIFYNITKADIAVTREVMYRMDDRHREDIAKIDVKIDKMDEKMHKMDENHRQDMQRMDAKIDKMDEKWERLFEKMFVDGCKKNQRSR